MMTVRIAHPELGMAANPDATAHTGRGKSTQVNEQSGGGVPPLNQKGHESR